MNNIIIVSIIVLCVLIICQITHFATDFLLKKKSSVKTIIFLPLIGNVLDIEYIVKKTLWKNQDDMLNLILLDCDTDQETLNICQKICNENPIISIIKKTDVTFENLLILLN